MEAAQNLVKIYCTAVCYFHAVTKVNEVLVCTFLLFRDQPVTAVRMSNSINMGGESITNPFTPITNPSANRNGMLKMARFGTSWKRI